MNLKFQRNEKMQDIRHFQKENKRFKWRNKGFYGERRRSLRVSNKNA